MSLICTHLHTSVMCYNVILVRWRTAIGDLVAFCFGEQKPLSPNLLFLLPSASLSHPMVMVDELPQPIGELMHFRAWASFHEHWHWYLSSIDIKKLLNLRQDLRRKHFHFPPQPPAPALLSPARTTHIHISLTQTKLLPRHQAWLALGWAERTLRG